MCTPIISIQIPTGSRKALTIVLLPDPPIKHHWSEVCRINYSTSLQPMHSISLFTLVLLEATAIGNILTQAMAKGEISDLRELREIVSRSVTPQVYYPKNKKVYGNT